MEDLSVPYCLASSSSHERLLLSLQTAGRRLTDAGAQRIVSTSQALAKLLPG